MESLEQLAQYVQRSIPEPRALSALRAQEQSDYVSFQWHSTQFVIKKSLQVFELRGQSLLVSGTSILMQAAFLQNERNQRVLTVVVDSMLQAQELVANGEDVALGLKLLGSVKQSLRKLSGSDGKQFGRDLAPRLDTALAAQPECLAVKHKERVLIGRRCRVASSSPRYFPIILARVSRTEAISLTPGWC